MKYLKFNLLLLVILLIAEEGVLAQQSDHKSLKELGFYQTVEASYVIGAQVFNDNFVYNPGYSFSTSYGKKLNHSVGIGLGIASRTFEDESFLPIYGEIIGYKKNKANTPFIRMQMGYALGWDNRSSQAEGYEFSGGVFLGAGMGRKIRLNDNFSIMLSWAYQHQFAKMEYEIYSTTNYSEILNYDMITISVGLIREKR